MESYINSYNKIAPFYDTLAHLIFGSKLESAQTLYLDDIEPGWKILIVGGGTGFILKEILARAEDIEVWYIDSSSEMIRLARKKVGSHVRVHFIHGSLDAIPSEILFDLALANFFLDQFSSNDIKDVIDRIAHSLQRDGQWWVTDFVPSSKWLHSALLRTMYGFFKMMAGLKVSALVDWVKLIEGKDFSSEKEMSTFSGFIRSIKFRKVHA